MAEIELIVNNFLNPSLSTLQELSANAISIHLFRYLSNERRKYVATGGIYFMMSPLQKIEHQVPTTVYRLIEEYSKNFTLSLERWLYERFFSKSTFLIFHQTSDDILKLFDDFVCDNNGAIHNVRTAKRMILCDRINQQEKFQIACEYCFEDDVRRLWLSVSGQLDLSEINISNRSLEYYWINRIINELSKKSRKKYFKRNFYSYGNITEESMLLKCPPHAWSSFQYFWQRLTLESQWRSVVDMFNKCKLVFAKFILPMLNEEQLDRFVGLYGTVWILDLLTYSKDEFEKIYYYVSPYKANERGSCFFSTWMYIKSKMDVMSFVKIIKKMFNIETDGHIVDDALNDTDERSSYNKKRRPNAKLETICFCDVWSSAPANWKLSATEHILRGKRLSRRFEWNPFDARETTFLMKILSDAISETKKVFWDINWYYLMTATRLQDLQRIMELCFENESEISRFKEDVLSKHENIDNYCCKLFAKCCFKKLDSFFMFWCPERQKRQCLKQQFLESSFLGIYCIFYTFDHLAHCHSINEFIDNAYEDANQSKQFKNKFVSLQSVQHSLVSFVATGNFSSLIAFVDTFVSVDEIGVKLKQDFVNDLKSRLIDGVQWLVTADELQTFLIWCLGDADEVNIFKHSISPVGVVHNTARNKNHYANNSFQSCFDIFLEWYFNTPDEIQQFKTKYSKVIEKFATKKNI